MLSKKKICERRVKLLTDPELLKPLATLDTDAVLALRQVRIETEIHALETVLEVPFTDFQRLREMNNS